MGRHSARQSILAGNKALCQVSYILHILGFIIRGPPSLLRQKDQQYWLSNGAKILPGNLEIAISALGYTLHCASKTVSIVCGTDGRELKQPIWSTPPALLHCLQKKGICKSDLRLFTGDRGFVTALMAMAAPGLSREGEHSRCTDDRCESDNINRDDHPRKHVDDVCVCGDFLLEREQNTMFQVIKRGGIPLVRVSSNTSGIEEQIDLEIIEAGPNTSYVAFSHVWAHGRGNGQGNSMYRCQWLWLQQCAQLSKAELEASQISAKGIVPFWIDTVCLPNGPGDQIRDLRTKSVSMMTRIYRDAETVILLDSALESAEHTNLFMDRLRLRFCSWSRRAWPLYEGAVAKNLHIRMGNHLIPWVNEKDPAFSDRDEKGTYPRPLLYDLENDCRIVLRAPWIMISDWVKEPNLRFKILWDELKYRATSVPNDRYLILAAICDLDAGKLENLQRIPLDESNAAEAEKDKIVSLLLSFPLTPRCIAFTYSERLQYPGLRWCPAWIGSDLYFGALEEGQLRYIKGRGLLVDCKGFRLKDHFSKILKLFLPYAWCAKLGQTRLRADFRTGMVKEPPSYTNLSDSPMILMISSLPGSEDTSRFSSRAILVREMGMGSFQDSIFIQVGFVASLRITNALEADTSLPDIRCSWVNGSAEQLWCLG